MAHVLVLVNLSREILIFSVQLICRDSDRMQSGIGTLIAFQFTTTGHFMRLEQLLMERHRTFFCSQSSSAPAAITGDVNFLRHHNKRDFVCENAVNNLCAQVEALQLCMQAIWT